MPIQYNTYEILESRVICQDFKLKQKQKLKHQPCRPATRSKHKRDEHDPQYAEADGSRLTRKNVSSRPLLTKQIRYYLIQGIIVWKGDNVTVINSTRATADQKTATVRLRVPADQKKWVSFFPQMLFHIGSYKKGTTSFLADRKLETVRGEVPTTHS